MLYERQKTLLTLLVSLGGESSALDFQKLLFLYCQESQPVPGYDFVPYRFGGFSFTSYADKRKLVQLGILTDDEGSWKLLKPVKPSSLLNSKARLQIEQFVRRYKNIRGDKLVAETYRRFPYYATRSEVAERILRDDPAAIESIKECLPAKRSAGILTLGYEGRSLDAYLNLLLQNSVTILCDVRRNPLSRKYGFAKTTLANACNRVGIRYEHLPQLGISSEDRRELDTQADYDSLFDTYRHDMLPRQPEALKAIRSWIAEGERVALTCFERIPQQCHRHCVADVLQRKFGKEFRPTHL